MSQLKLKNYRFQDLFNPHKLQQLDADFLVQLAASNNKLHQDLLGYRAGKTINPIQLSELLIAVAKELEVFITELFQIEVAVEQSRQSILQYNPIFTFKKWVVTRRAKRRLLRDESLPSFVNIDAWLNDRLEQQPSQPLPQTGEDKNSDAPNTRELRVAQYAESLLADKEAHEEQLEKLTQWCIQAIKTPEGQVATGSWISLKLPKARDYQKLIPIIPESQLRKRDGFKLTDQRMSELEVLDEVHYCVYCHENDGDFCSKGFPEKKGEPSQGLRKNPLENTLTGCPLEEKISEMQLLKRDAYTIASLAMVMLDNPMCPATGHRICNDCMKACIYQKQNPVDIPQIETRVLTDVLDLPWGVEIYDLLTRWNPLRQRQYLSKPYNGLKVLIAGMGPAGFTLAHHLLMEGFAVTGVDGLKIEPLPSKLISNPIKDYHELEEQLDERTLTGFGGVAEYGITVRWDKNFLKLLYLNLRRRPHFQVFGNVRFGGTITVEDAWALGFDHLAMAVGAGLPRALPIPGSLAPGMRQANDFLMALQLTGAAKENSLANLQLRLPALVVGGGLTGVDTATEAQAYYIKQVEKTLQRYEILKEKLSEQAILERLNMQSRAVLEEFLLHGVAVREERARAAQENEAPNFIKLIRQWGGVSIVYRRSQQQSPAYRLNHEELHKALEEGIYYIEHRQPVRAQLDQHGHIDALICENTETGEQTTITARSVLVATGANLNIAYEFEHQGTFKRDGLQYQTYEFNNGQLQQVSTAKHVKANNFGPFSSYQQNNKFVSFVGDSHPVFHGSVVRAIASAMRTYPKILDLFIDKLTQVGDDKEYQKFATQIKDKLTATISDIKQFDHVIELTVHAPMAAEKYRPGMFYRLQHFETNAEQRQNTLLQTEALALTAFGVNKQRGTLKFMILPQGASSKICARFKRGAAVALMGPTGVRSKIPSDAQTILIIGDQLSLAYVRALGPALKAQGHKVIYLAYFCQARSLYCQKAVQDCTDICIWAVKGGDLIKTHRKQDFSIKANPLEALQSFAEKHPELVKDIKRMTVIGDTRLVEQIKQARCNELKPYLAKTKSFASAYTPMQCMLKGVCSQCLIWQIDPTTGERKKAVYACSWQDQPIDYIDLNNLDERLSQNRLSEVLSDLWVEHL